MDNPQSEKPIIQMKGIDKFYQVGSEQLQALKQIELSVNEGEFLAILVPSGSGKTTLMNIIGCMDRADEGTYYLDGIAVHEAREKELTRIRNEKIGFVFQKYHLIPTYNVVQNIVMPLLMRGMTFREAEEESEEIIEMLGLSDRIHHKPRELSGGQQQRVAIARALVGEPSLLLADEPTGALDQASGKDVLRLFSNLNEMGHTIVMITHDLKVAENARRIVHIIDGELTES